MKYTVGISDCKVSNNPQDVIETRSLGSCVGIAIYDPVANVGGVLHYLLPMAEKAQTITNPYQYGNYAIPLFFKSSYELGAMKSRLIVVVAGGSKFLFSNDRFRTCERNVIIAKKLFWKNGIIVESENTGGYNIPRSLIVDLGTGEIKITSKGETLYSKIFKT